MRVWVASVVILLGGLLYLCGPRTYAHRRIVALGDLHGDYAQALDVLRATHVLDAYTLHWAGGATVLVSTGDTVDRGDDTIALYNMFASLRNESVQAGGRVITLLGNHEMMNAMGDWRYVTPGDMASFGGAKARRHAMSMDGWLGREWLTNYAVTASVPLLEERAALALAPSLAHTLRASFVHGGLAPAWARIGANTTNDIAHRLLRKALTAPATYGAPPHDATREERELWSADGPLWYRGYALDAPKKACANAADAVDALGVHTLVMGHTPQLGGIARRCSNDRLYIIDTGMSRAYGGRASALVITSYLRRGWYGPVCAHTTYTAVYAHEGEQRLSHAVQCA
ncbi:hypothetical protein MNAN1_003513 [Malassezia nana]|uniref:Calcineurin-like phosphoesterase domain-containing protein n=1 Tax=Malassezia nana TaxID=180528 RepID=A0AAF0EU56_9BASI|nr:hypothetical protein MNAN1_003513 [Malassezia nana]